MEYPPIKINPLDPNGISTSPSISEEELDHEITKNDLQRRYYEVKLFLSSLIFLILSSLILLLFVFLYLSLFSYILGIFYLFCWNLSYYKI